MGGLIVACTDIKYKYMYNYFIDDLPVPSGHVKHMELLMHCLLVYHNRTQPDIELNN